MMTGLAVAASFALLIFALSGLFQKTTYDQFAQHQALNLVEKSETAPIAIKAQEEFNTKNYAAAFESLTTYLTQSPEDNKAVLAKGICALELNRFPAAIAIFDQIHSGTSALKTSGTWYLALSYLKQNDLQQTKKYLHLIPDSDSFYAKKAEDLLAQLK